MSIGVLICFGFAFIGGLINLIVAADFFVLLVSGIAFLGYAFYIYIENDIYPPPKFIDKFKACYCKECRKGFWTDKEFSKHNWSTHPAEMKLLKSRRMQEAARRKNGISQPHWYDCPRCHGKAGNYMCPRCEGLGKTLHPFDD